MRRTAFAWFSMLARRAGLSPHFRPSSIRARITICRLTGSLSVLVALPAKTRARSWTSWESTRRILVLCANIAPPIISPPLGKIDI
jgi:hypothetical protein